MLLPFVFSQYALKGQKLLAQGIALGSLVFPLSPCKGKSFKTISRFYLNIEKFTLP